MAMATSGPWADGAHRHVRHRLKLQDGARLRARAGYGSWLCSVLIVIDRGDLFVLSGKLESGAKRSRRNCGLLFRVQTP